MPAVCYEVPRTFADLTTRNSPSITRSSVCPPRQPCFPQSISKSGAEVLIFLRTAQRLSNELFATLQQVCAKLAAGPREIMKGIEIKVASQGYHDTARVSIAIRQSRLLRFSKWVGCCIMLTDNNLGWLQIHCGSDWDVRRLKLMPRESCRR